ncbi:MAG: hypothetical protein OEU26_00180 [Candidatus Tectomicrobia bacterium]|nr:hypothetical protein [Candidatus Tectomicrobia bacterium]
MKLGSIKGYGPEDPEVIPGSELTPRLRERLCAEAMDTPSITQVANRVGIPVTLLYDWLKKGRDGNPRFAPFLAEFQKARGTHEDRWLQNVEDVAALDDARAANAKLRANEFLLRSHFRGQYTERATSGTQIENQTTFNVKVLNDTQRRALHTMLKAVVAGNDGAGDDEVHQLLADLPIAEAE